jgi:hypothetical protein
MKKLFLAVFSAALLGMFSCGGGSQKVEDVGSFDSTAVKFTYPEGSPVAKWGALQVKGLQLRDKNGNPVQLAGVSTMGWHWCGDCYNRESFEYLKEKWNINVLRLAMYVEEGGYNSTPEETFKKMCDFIDICGEMGIYCIADWHILTPGNPLDPKYSGAEDFFKRLSSKYAGADHIIYEICNEPNNCMEKNNPEKPWECTKNGCVTWDTISAYANKIIPIIHASADSVGATHPIVIVGTPQWDQLVDACLKVGMCQGNGKDLSDPLPERDARLKFDNIMYAFHFYALEHKEGLDEKPGYYNFYSYMYDVLGKLPVFCSEYGVTYADGDRGIDLPRTDKWMLMFQGNNSGKQLVSSCNWSFSDNERLSSALKPGSCAKKQWDSTTVSGEYIKKIITSINTGVRDSSVLKPEHLYTK